MAKPKPTKVELANCMVKLYAVEGLASTSKLESWDAMGSLPRSKSPGSIALAELAKQCSGKSLGPLQSVAIPMMAAGVNMDVTSLDTNGAINCCALAAAMAVDCGKADTQVLIFGSTPEHLKSIQSELESMAKSIKCGPLGSTCQVAIGRATDVDSANVMGPTLVIVAEVDRICRSGDRDATQIAEIIKAGEGKTQALLFSGEVLLEGAGPDPGGRRIRDFQARAMGLKNYAQVLGSWDLADFLGKAKIRGLDMVKFGTLGLADLKALEMCDPKALHSGLGPDVARSIAGALEAEGNRKMQGAGFAVPPFDMCSGQWEWTPDKLEAWQAKGLDPKYFHTEPDGSTWIFSSAVHAALSSGAGAAGGGYTPAPWDVNPNLMPDGGEDFGGGGIDDDEADAAWAEMMGADQGGGGGGRGGGGLNNMGGMGGALLDPIACLGPELGSFVLSLPVHQGQAADLVMALQNARIGSVAQLSEIRWSLTMSLGIDYGLASIVAGGLP